jgi:hypothetical protein
MRNSAISPLQIELDFFAVTPVLTVLPQPTLFTPRVVPSSFRWLNEPEFEASSPRMKLADNMAALRLLKRLQSDGSPATPDEQGVLARYNGWGGLALVFEANPREWKADAEELKTLLTVEDYRSARATVNTAFFTPWSIARSIYQALERFGFKGGKALEPSAGTGLFPAAQPTTMKLDWHCVEIDTVSGAILKHLQPDARMQVCGLQDAHLPSGGFDLVVGNVPFGDYPIHDRRLGNPLVHDYFLLRSVELLRPGGIVAVITSRGTLDKTNPEIRQRIASTSDLLGAIRLPETVFARRALTTVTTDILFLQRRSEGQPLGDAAWTHTGTVYTPAGDVEINQYFVLHPEMIVGRMVPNVGRYGEPACRLDLGDDLAAMLTAAIQKLPANCYHPEEEIHFGLKPGPEIPDDETLAQVKESGYAVKKDGTVWRRENGVLTKLEGIGITRIHRIKGLLKVRDAARAYLEEQAQGTTDSELETHRANLNQQYDRFLADHGPINTRANQLALSGDPDLPFLMALEDFDATTQTATKAPFFSERTLDPKAEIVHAESASDALVYCMREKGHVDVDYIAKLTGKETKSIIDELVGRIFFDPESNRWETADEYLSGEVVHKLRVVQKLRRPDLVVNVAALEAAQPKPLGPGEIRIKLGAPWIPTEVIQQFAEDLLSS